MLYELLVRIVRFPRANQLGSRKGYQCLEIVQIIRALIEKSYLWGTHFVLVSIDLYKAFDHVSIAAIRRVLRKYKVPIRIRYALIRAYLRERKRRFYLYNKCINFVQILRRLTQGSPEAA